MNEKRKQTVFLFFPIPKKERDISPLLLLFKVVAIRLVRNFINRWPRRKLVMIWKLYFVSPENAGTKRKGKKDDDDDKKIGTGSRPIGGGNNSDKASS